MTPTLQSQYKRNFGPEGATQRKNDVCRSFSAPWGIQITGAIYSIDISSNPGYLRHARGASSYHFWKGWLFDVVFIDEAAQGLEAASWIPIIKAKKVGFLRWTFPTSAYELSPFKRLKDGTCQDAIWKK